MRTRHLTLRLLLGLLLLMAAGCTNSPIDSKSSNADPNDSHQRMVALLEDVRQRALVKNEYFETVSVQEISSQLAALPEIGREAERFQLHWQLGPHYLRLGMTRQAIDQMLKAEELLPLVKEELTPQQMDLFLLDVAVAYLRLAENENCIHCRTGESCILPIRGDGVHAKSEGSRKAIDYLDKMLDRNPQDLVAIWLLNIANMTLGTYPDGVPERFRIPPEKFQSEVEFPRFVDVAKDLGLATINCAGSVIIDDFDGDGDLDIVKSSWEPSDSLLYFRNNGDGSFTDRTKEANLEEIAGGLNCIQADYDNDGDVDVLVLRGAWLVSERYPNSLLQNDGKGTFRDVTFDAGLCEDQFRTQNADWADYDNDGDLDLFIGNERFPSQLFQNDGQGRFKNVALKAGVTNDRFAKGCAWGDYDGDRYMDLYVSNLDGDNRLYHNNGDGTFTDVASKLGVTRPMKGFPCWFWDFNNDGALDIFASSYDIHTRHVAADFLGLPDQSEPDCLYQGDGKGGFQEVAREMGLTRVTQPMGSNFGDIDNDGFPDFHLGTGYVNYQALMPNLMFWNRGGKKFVDVTMAGGFGHLQKGHGDSFADLDCDGDLDLFAQTGGANPGDAFGNVLYENPGFGNHWLAVRLIGTESNRSAIGAVIRADITEEGTSRSVYAHVGTGGSFGANPLRQHLGLGQATKVDRLEVFWPKSGKTQSFPDVKADVLVKIREGEDKLREVVLAPTPFKKPQK